MLARNESLFKWALYAGLTILLMMVQGSLLQRITLWNVIPFLYPILAAIPATYEGSVAGTLFALCLGIVCDLSLAAPLPCFYTLILPLVGLCSSLISRSLLPAGVLCSLVCTAVAFLLTDGFHCLVLWADGKPAWAAGAMTMAQEFCVSVLLSIPVTWLYRAVYRRTHWDD